MRSAFVRALCAALISSCGTNTDPEAGRAYPCFPELGRITSACPGGWKCGLEGYCHAPAVPAPYLCNTDEDCEGGWRCSVQSQRCVNAENEYLLEIADPTNQSIALKSPAQFPRVGSQLFALSRYGTVAGATFAVDNGVTRIELDLNAQAAKGVTVFPAVAPRAVSTYQNQSFALTGSAISREQEGVVTNHPLPMNDAERLETIEGDDPLLLASSSRAMAFFPLKRTGAVDRVELKGVDGGAQQLADFASLGRSGAILVTADEGLFVAPRSGTSFVQPDGGEGPNPAWRAVQPSGLPNRQCRAPAGSDGGIRLGRIQVGAGAEDRVGVELLSSSGEASVLVMKRAAGLEVSTSPTCSNFQFTDSQVVKPCPPGSTLETFYFLPEGTTTRLVARCKAGMEERDFYDANTPVPQGAVNLAVEPSRSTPAPGYVDVAGRIWASLGQGTLESLLLAEAPALFGRDAQERRVAASPSGKLFVYTPSVGLFAAGFTQYPCGSIRGAPQYWISTAYASSGNGIGVVRAGDLLVPSQTPPNPVLMLNDSDDIRIKGTCRPQWPSPFMGTLAKTADDGTLLLVAGEDRLWAVDWALPGTGALPRADVKLVPRSFGKISSLVALAPEGDDFASGYLVAQHRVFHFHAESATRWRAEEVMLPLGEVHAVWSDQGRGRVGFQDGRVFSLPGLIALSKPFDNGAEVSGYESLCGVNYAVGSMGLQRLERNGDWTAVALSGAGTLSPSRFAGGSLFADGNMLWVFDRYGAGFEISGSQTCL